LEGQHTVYPDYSEYLPKLTTADRAHADVFNVLFHRLINNDAWLKAFIDVLMKATTGHKHTGVDGDGPQISTSGIADGAVTLPKMTWGGEFELVLNEVDNSLDFERPVDGIPYIRTDNTFSGTLDHIEYV